jgi:hypothetical protein
MDHTDGPNEVPMTWVPSDTRRRELLGLGSLMKQSSMPELTSRKDKLNMQAVSDAATAAFAASALPFMRTASAEDENVGAIRTRVMNAQFVKHHRSTIGAMPSKLDPKRGMHALRSASMPSKIMKQVFMSCPSDDISI